MDFVSPTLSYSVQLRHTSTGQRKIMQRLGAVDADHSDVSPSLVGILVGPRDNKGDPLAAG